MSTHPKPTGHSIRAISFDCSCGVSLSAPAPYILEREFAAQTRFRPLPKAPGYVFGGAFK